MLYCVVHTVWAQIDRQTFRAIDSIIAPPLYLLLEQAGGFLPFKSGAMLTSTGWHRQ